MKITLTKILLLVIIALGIALWATTCQSRKFKKQAEQKGDLITALGDTLRTIRQTDSSQKAQIQVLYTERIEDILTMRSKDSAIVALQSVIKVYKKKLEGGGSAVVVKGETKIRDSGKTDEVRFVDSPKINDNDTGSIHWIEKEIPNIIFAKTFGNKWYEAYVELGRDSGLIDLKVINSYDVVISKEKGTWVADVINHNPYSSTTAMRAYKTVTPKEVPKRFGLSLFAGYGVLLQNKPTTGPIVGAGITYTPIRF